MTDDASPSAADESLAHLQAAAREMISAARAMLDAAEQVVDDPQTVGKAVGWVADLARAATARGGHSATDDDDDEGGLERIEVR